MKVRQVGTEDRDAWDALVSESPDSTYAHDWGWLELYGSHLSVRPLALALEERGEFIGVYGGVLARSGDSLLRRAILGGLTFWSPHDLTWDYGGPCFEPEIRNSAGRELIKAMDIEALRAGAWSSRISPLATRTAQMLENVGYKPRERLTAILCLKGSEGDLWSNLRKTFRRSVVKAERWGLEFEVGQGASILEEFLACVSPVAALRGFQIPPRMFLEDLLTKDTNLLRTHWSAVRDSTGTVQAIGILLAHKGMVTARWGAVTPEGMNLGANHLRLWRTIVWASARGFSSFDLGGLPSDPSHGIYRFKTALGGEIRHVDWYVRHLRFGQILRFKRLLEGRNGYR